MGRGLWRTRGYAFMATLAFHLIIVGMLYYLPVVGNPVSAPTIDAHSAMSAREAKPEDLVLLTLLSVSVPPKRSLADFGKLASLERRELKIELPDVSDIAQLPQAHDDEPTVSLPRRGVIGVHCEVHIHQAMTGQVQAVDFGECTGDQQWQRVLMGSISRAAALVSPGGDRSFPPVRTWNFETESISPEDLANQLSRTN